MEGAVHSDHLFPFTCVDFTSNDTPVSAAAGIHPPARRCGPDGGQTEVLQARLCLGVSFKDFLVAHFLWSFLSQLCSNHWDVCFCKITPRCRFWGMSASSTRGIYVSLITKDILYRLFSHREHLLPYPLVSQVTKHAQRRSLETATRAALSAPTERFFLPAPSSLAPSFRLSDCVLSASRACTYTAI